MQSTMDIFQFDEAAKSEEAPSTVQATPVAPPPPLPVSTDSLVDGPAEPEEIGKLVHTPAPPVFPTLPGGPDWEAQRLAAAEFAAKLGARRRDAGAPVRMLFVHGWEPGKPGALATLLSGD